jgi:hypothetical protein
MGKIAQEHTLNLIRSDLASNYSTLNIYEKIQITGKYNGKQAYVFYILGRRASFTSTTIFNDLGEGLGVTAQDSFYSLDGTETIQVLSAGINDTVGGIGANYIKMTYINSQYQLVETNNIAMNGVAAVDVLVGGCLQVLWFEVTSVGSNEGAVNNLTLRTSVPLTLSYVPANSNKSMDAIFMIPDGYSGYIKDWAFGNIQNSQDLRLRATVNSFDRSLSTVYHFQDNQNTASNTGFSNDLPFLKYPSRCKIKVSTITSSTAANTRADCGFPVILIQN